MITETIFAGRDNVFSLQLVRGGEAINLLTVEGYELTLSDGVNDDKVFTNSAYFKDKPDGVVEISIGEILTADDASTYIAHLVTFDPVNLQGVRWPNFKLKVK
jgi:hypothetical protein